MQLINPPSLRNLDARFRDDDVDSSNTDQLRHAPWNNNDTITRENLNLISNERQQTTVVDLRSPFLP